MSRMMRLAIVGAVGFALGLMDAPAVVAAAVLFGTILIAHDVTR